MVALKRGHHASQHVDSHLGQGLFDLDDLKAPSQRRVAFDIALVFGPGGRGDRSKLTASQGRLEQVGGVALAFGAARADQLVGFVDEQDHRRR